MLSFTTLELLDQFQAASNAAYSEGGLLYTYTEAANQAHSRLPELVGGARAAKLAPPSTDELARFLQASQGDYLSSEPSEVHRALATALMRALEGDLRFDYVTWFLEEGGHDMHVEIKMAKTDENRFFSLELFWSID